MCDFIIFYHCVVCARVPAEESPVGWCTCWLMLEMVEILQSASLALYISLTLKVSRRHFHVEGERNNWGLTSNQRNCFTSGVKCLPTRRTVEPAVRTMVWSPSATKATMSKPSKLELLKSSPLAPAKGTKTKLALQPSWPLSHHAAIFLPILRHFLQHRRRHLFWCKLF